MPVMLRSADFASVIAQSYFGQGSFMRRCFSANVARSFVRGFVRFRPGNSRLRGESEIVTPA